MKCLVRKSDNTVIYAQDDLEISDNYVSGDGWIDRNHNSENSVIVDAEIPEDFVGAAWGYVEGNWFVIDQNAIDNFLSSKKMSEMDVENALKAFMSERKIDSIGEAKALVDSTNPDWVIEAKTVVRLWDETWQAFEANTALPDLSWD